MQMQFLPHFHMSQKDLQWDQIVDSVLAPNYLTAVPLLNDLCTVSYGVVDPDPYFF